MWIWHMSCALVVAVLVAGCGSSSSTQTTKQATTTPKPSYPTALHNALIRRCRHDGERPEVCTQEIALVEKCAPWSRYDGRLAEALNVKSELGLALDNERLSAEILQLKC